MLGRGALVDIHKTSKPSSLVLVVGLIGNHTDVQTKDLYLDRMLLVVFSTFVIQEFKT